MSTPTSSSDGLHRSPPPARQAGIERLRRWPLILRIVIAVALQLLIGWLDYLGGRGASFFVFYALPIALVTWVVDRRAGLWLAVVTGFIWRAANQGHQYVTTPWGIVWVTAGRIAYFVFIAIGTAALRTKQETDAARIQMLDDMRQLELELVNSREREQQRLGQDLHDGLCQQLAAISCAVEALADDLKKRAVPEAADASHIGSVLQKTVTEARQLAGGMTSLHIERGGLSAALATLAQTSNHLGNVPVRLYDSAGDRIANAEHATHLYRIAQEAVSNAIRHSGASEITLRVEEKGPVIELRIDDNGHGFTEQPDRRATGIGLQTMRYRAHAIGADFILHPRPGGGTSVRCTLPISDKH